MAQACELASERPPELHTVQTAKWNLIVGEQVGEPVDAAEISAAAFRVTGVPPLIGRVLVDEDESPQSPAVVVLGNRLWKMRFGADSAVLGRVEWSEVQQSAAR